MLVLTGMCCDVLIYGRYTGLFGDHIVPAVLHRYTQVLRREDLINSKGKPLVTTARNEAVWKRSTDRFGSVVAVTTMIILSTEYAAHFYEICIRGKENAKMTGDRMKMLMLTLPFMVRDLIAPEVIVSEYVRVCTQAGENWYVLQHNQYVRIYTRLSSSTRP
jgi:hypothetical protein